MEILFNHFNMVQKITDMLQNMQAFTCNQKHEKNIQNDLVFRNSSKQGK